jgi:hypothetical protein
LVFYYQTILKMLEENLTPYQLLNVLEQKEFLQKIINLLNSSKRAFGSIDYVIKQEQEYCLNNNVKLPEMYPDHQPS